jgi:DNA-binding NtrC family response regulator/pSer/pThr/pTyr-binding forkhead associated (FHA) protein
MSSSAILYQKEHNKKIALQGRIVTIGSSEDCHIRLQGEGVPGRTAHLLYTSGIYELQKLHSSVSLYVNGKKIINKVALKHGDVIIIEKSEFVYSENDISDEPIGEVTNSSPMSELIKAIVDLLHSKDNALYDSLVVSVARLMRADAARIVVEDPQTHERTTLTRYPVSSGLDRFSNRAVDWAAESNVAIIMHADQWRESELSMRSLERNLVESVLCAPLKDSGIVFGYLYLDRVSNNDGFSNDDKVFLDALLPLLSEILSTFSEKKRQKETIERLQVANIDQGSGIIFESEVMKEVLGRAKRFSRTDSPVLITGETGTGKELMARFVHDNSSRAGSAFKAINCGAIPENLIESELFGHEKGSFTGAIQRKIGLFEAAESGTVFLDEIGELPLQLQVRLLRVLQESEVTRVGGTDVIKINVRVVAATNRSLEQEIVNGTFRQDLYFRLHVLTLNLPPLRDRGADIHLLLEYFTKKYCQQFGLPQKTFSASAKKNFLLHSWPGNIRELENAVQKAILMSDQQVISPEDFNVDAIGSVLKLSGDSDPVTLHEARDRAEKTAIVNALVKTKGNVSLSSRILDIDRKWLMKKMDELGISADRYR